MKDVQFVGLIVCVNVTCELTLIKFFNYVTNILL